MKRISHRFFLLLPALALFTISTLQAEDDQGVTSAEELIKKLKAPPAPEKENNAQDAPNATGSLTRGSTRDGTPASNTRGGISALTTRGGSSPGTGSTMKGLLGGTADETGAKKAEAVVKRRGYTTRSSADGMRGIAIVETTGSAAVVEVAVAPQANVSFQNVRFKLGSTELLDQTSRDQLDQIATALKALADDGSKFLIEGHTCPIGSESDNNELSLARAEAVRNYLLKAEVPAPAVAAIGCGESEAKAKGLTPESDENVLATYRKVMVHRQAE